MRVLYVDASESYRDQVSRWLSLHKVDGSRDLPSAVLQAQAQKYDLVLMDKHCAGTAAEAIDLVTVLHGTQILVVEDLGQKTDEHLPDEDPLTSIDTYVVASMRAPSSECDCVDPGSLLVDVRQIMQKVSGIQKTLKEGHQ